MEIIEINKNRRSIVEITDDERRLILDCLTIDKLKYNVIDQISNEQSIDPILNYVSRLEYLVLTLPV